MESEQMLDKYIEQEARKLFPKLFESNAYFNSVEIYRESVNEVAEARLR